VVEAAPDAGVAPVPAAEAGSAPAASRARVFVSYSRADLDFVRRMRELLARDGRDVWVDLDDIPSSAEWQREIDAGIDAADVVIVVLSPDWVASGPCRAELERALSGGKRLVPVLRHTVDQSQVPPELASIQWLSCLGSASADGVIDELTATLDTDLDWVKAHTRLLVRALEWEGKSEDRSLLLRGTDLSSAETALAAHGDDEPAPTALQRRYVVTSRQAATRSGRIRLGAVSVALAVSLGLTVFAFLERSEARHQANVATVRALAASSVAEEGRDPELSLLIGLEAVKRSDSAEAVGALRQALERSQLIGEMHTSSSTQYHAVSFSPTTRGLATAADDGVRITNDWLDPSSKGRFLDTGPAFDVEWSPDGARVVTAGGDAKARVWDTATGKELLVLADHGGQVTSAAFSADGTRIVTTSVDGLGRIWDAHTGLVQMLLVGHADVVRTAAFSPDGTRVVTGSFDNTARVWDAASGAPILVLRSPRSGPQPVTGVTFSPDGKNIVTTGQKVATIWDATDGHLVRELVGHESGQVYSALYGPGGNRIVTAGGDSTARIWDAATGTLLSTLYGHTDQVEHAAFTPNGAVIATASEDRSIRLWKSEPGADLVVFPNDGVRVTGAALSPNGRQVVVGRTDGVAVLWTLGASPSEAQRLTTAMPATLRIELRGHTLPIFWVTFSPTGHTIATSSIDGTVRLWDAGTGALEHVLPSQPTGYVRGRTAAVDFSSNGRFLVGATGDRVFVWDVRRGSVVASWQPSKDANYFIHRVVFAPSGQRVLIADNNGDAILASWRAGAAALRTIHADAHELYSAAFSRDGSRIVTSGTDGIAKVWDARTGKRLTALRGHVGIVFDAEFSPDGKHIVTAGSDATARLWDAVHGGPALVVFHGHTDLLATAGFSKDGKQIITSSADGTARLFDCTLCESVPRLVRLAKASVTRELTPSERRRLGL
jgi:WD40 repeat protein